MMRNPQVLHWAVQIHADVLLGLDLNNLLTCGIETS